MKKKLSIRNKSCFLIGLTFLFCSITMLRAQDKHYRVVINADKEQLVLLQAKGLEVDHFHYENGKITAEISRKDLLLLRKNNIKHKVKIRNLEKRIPRINKRIDKQNARKSVKAAQQVPTPSNFELGTMGGFHTHDEAIAVLDKMRQLYPQLITAKSSIGTSIQGRPIYMVKISDNADTDENEGEMLFTSLHHAREPIGLSQNLFYMWYLLENYATNDEVKTLVDNSELYFIPIVNPDGYLYNQQTNANGGGFWRKNRRNNGSAFGVDLNRNYSYQWAAPGGSSSNPSSDTYHGTAGFSEPETQALRDFTNQHEFIVALNYHSFSNLLIHPWGYKANTFTPDQSTFVAMCTYMTEENSYTYGTPNQTVGYWAGGSSDDWMYGEQTSKPKVFALTPEVGSSNDGFWPASSRIIPLCNESYYFNSKAMRMAAKYADITPSSSSQTVTELNGTIGFSIKRFSLQDATWTVSLSSTSSNVNSFGQPKSYTNLSFLGTQNGTIAFELKSSTPTGTQIPVTITVSNGTWQYTKNTTIIYNGTGTTCSATVPNGVSSSNVGNSTATISWNTVSGTSYDLRYRQTGVTTWTTVNVDQTSFAISGLSATTDYEAQVRSKCPDGSTSNYSTSVTFTTTSTQVAYCTASGNNASEEYISNVKLGAINNTTSVGSGYTDHTSISTDLSKGVSNTITITPTWTGSTYSEAYGVWIDYNQDGDFEDAGEQVWTQSSTRNTPVSGDFTVPTAATDGNTRMRVSMRYNAAPSACGTFNYGEVEDYTVNIKAGGTVGNDICLGVAAYSTSQTYQVGDRVTYQGNLYERTQSGWTNLGACGTSVISKNENVSVILNSFYSMFPNPVTDRILNIKLNTLEEVPYAISDIQGKTVLKGKCTSQIDVGDLNSGVYILTIFDKNKGHSARFIKE